MPRAPDPGQRKERWVRGARGARKEREVRGARDARKQREVRDVRVERGVQEVRVERKARVRRYPGRAHGMCVARRQYDCTGDRRQVYSNHRPRPAVRPLDALTGNHRPPPPHSHRPPPPATPSRATTGRPHRKTPPAAPATPTATLTPPPLPHLTPPPHPRPTTRPVTSPNPTRVPSAPGAHARQGHLVAVFQERPLAGREFEGVAAVPGEFQQRAALAFERAADRAGAVEVAGAEGRAVGRHLGELLGGRPVHGGERRLGHRVAVDRDGDAEVVAAGFLGRVVQVGEEFVGALGRGDPGVLQRVQRGDPRRHRRGEGLAEERAEGDVLPGLDVACRPVVEEAQAEHVLAEVGERHRRAHRRRRAHHEADLRLDVQADGRAEHGRGVGGGLALSGRTDDIRARDDDRAGAAVVTDRQVLPVGGQRVGGVGAEDAADVPGVVLGGVEVDVVRDLEGEVQGHRREGVEVGVIVSWWEGTVTHAVSARRTSDQAVWPAARSGPRVGCARRETYGEPRASAAAPASRTWSPSRTPTVRSSEPTGEKTP